MKSAYELAMERLGGEVREYTEEQKEQLADIDKVYDAKAAQAKFDAKARLGKAAGDAEKQEQIRKDLVTELASVESKREREKEKLRKSFQKAE